MKVGDYVRTKDGIITKITWVIEEQGTINKTIFGKYQCKNKEVYSYPDEFKSSPNIIDLIEVGDYIDKLRVVDKDENYIVVETFDERIVITKEDTIKSIVTKEQFSQMEYKL